MKKRLWSNRKNSMRVLVVLVFFISFAGMGRAQTTAFKYQGSLKDDGAAANGSFQMQFKLFDSLGGAGQIGSTITDVPVTVTQGVFSVTLDFGSNALGGANRWLEIAVRHNSGESYVTLAPRNQIASSPYSVRTLSAASADGLSSNCVACVQDSNINSLSGAKITGTVSNATTATTATNATQLNGQTAPFYQNAANLSSGTLPDARLSANVATLAGIQTFSGAKTFSAPAVFNNTVGVGTSSPRASLDVLGNLGFGFAPGGHFYADANFAGFFAGTNTSAGIAINQTTNNVGIGTISPQHALSIVGGLNVDQGNQNTTSNGFGITFGSFSGEGIASNRGAGANPNGLDFFAGGGITPRVSLTNSGNVGIGTASPGERLQIEGSDATMRIRNTNDSGGGYIQNSFSTLQLGMFNPSASAVGQVPAGGKRAFFGVSADGRVGSTTNLNNGNPTFRNLVDDGSGNASFNGNIAAHNLPGLEFDVPADPFDDGVVFFVDANQTATVKTITVDVPANGFLFFSGSVFGESRVISGPAHVPVGTLALFDETSNTTIATAKFAGTITTETIQGVLPVSAGSRTLSLKIGAGGTGEQVLYWSNTGRLIVMFFPVRY